MPQTTRWTQRPPGSNWGDFGPDDQCGRLNLLTPERVRRAAQEITEGRGFCLSLPLDKPGGNLLNPRRFPPVLRLTLRNGLPNYNYRMQRDNPNATDVLNDDAVILLTQYSTQWDGLCHVGQLFDADGDGVAEPVYYNGFRAGTNVVGPSDPADAGATGMVSAQATLLHGPVRYPVEPSWRRRFMLSPDPRMPTLPFKLNQDRRHHIPKQKRRVTNPAAYDAALRQRGSLTVWFTEEAVAAWKAEPRTTAGGQPWYSPLAILTALTLRAVFRLALRQTEGLIGSIIQLLGLDLAVPDHSTLSRRAATLEVPRPQPRRDGAPMHLLVDSTGLRLCGAGEWLVEKHGAKTRRSWRTLHIGMDADTGQIVAATLTRKEVDDGSQVGPLLDRVTASVASFTADGAYDQDSVSAAVAQRHPEAATIVPPRCTAVPSETAEIAPTQRDRHLQFIAKHGRAAWQKASGYTVRARAEAAIGRFKQVIGDGLRSRTDERRAIEVNVAVHALNRMLDLGRPNFVRVA